MNRSDHVHTTMESAKPRNGNFIPDIVGKHFLGATKWVEMNSEGVFFYGVNIFLVDSKLEFHIHEIMVEYGTHFKREQMSLG